MPDPRGTTILLAILLAACHAPIVQPNEASGEAVARGRAAAERLGCGACHVLPGIAWPQGRVGPDLNGLATRAMIAGRLPNRPETIAMFVRDAPALAPGTAMPAIPMSEHDARDIAAWLQQPDG